MTNQIRNIAIIAHVDHGKTTLVDALLKQTQVFMDHQSEMNQELIMDSMDQEKERGITITAKVTGVEYDNYKINIIDTPGHADFGGEVERTLHMADGCLLVVDAQEGPMPQTKFVLRKAFEASLKPIVVINKIDKPAAQISVVVDKLADLFLELAEDESQLDYKVFYAIGRNGKVWEDVPDDLNTQADVTPLLNAIINDIPPPSSLDGGFQLLATALQWDDHEGKYVIGKVQRGSIKSSDSVSIVDGDSKVLSQAKITKVYGFKGLVKTEMPQAQPGDIVALAGIKDAQIGQTITSSDNPEGLASIALEPPTLSMYMGPNTSPLKGNEGEFTTSRQISDRLKKELETNVGLHTEESGIGFIVSGRGELHLSVLIETMRREGYELEVGRPQVVFKEQDNQVLEPVEEVSIEVPAQYLGAVQSELNKRRGEMTGQENDTNNDASRLTFLAPTRWLLGFRNSLISATKGTAIISSVLHGYRQKIPGEPTQERNGALIAWEQGVATPYSIQNIEARGTLIISPGQEVYEGQVIGLCNKREDLDVNVTKEKHLNNMRSSSSDGAIQLTPVTPLSLEESINFIQDDELLEVTPKSLRIRKRELNKGKRKRLA